MALVTYTERQRVRVVIEVVRKETMLIVILRSRDVVVNVSVVFLFFLKVSSVERTNKVQTQKIVEMIKENGGKKPLNVP